MAGARQSRSRAGASDLAPEPGPESGSGLDEQKVGVECWAAGPGQAAIGWDCPAEYSSRIVSSGALSEQTVEMAGFIRGVPLRVQHILQLAHALG